ncbi:MAG: hypothetical protein GY847_01645 [Proteobacteria bacterium]|nr:hypothetical protein [Pseudomonadota bacterium]
MKISRITTKLKAEPNTDPNTIRLFELLIEKQMAKIDANHDDNEPGTYLTIGLRGHEADEVDELFTELEALSMKMNLIFVYIVTLED